MAQIIALANQKGGVAKTSSTINLGAALVEQGQRILLVDLDPQASLTIALGIDPAILDASIYTVLMHERSIVQVLRQAAGMAVAPATIDLAEAEIRLMNEVGREQVLAEELADVAASFDTILIDCPPSLGQLTINALTAANTVLVPIECSYLALRGLEQLMTTITKVRRRSNPQLQILGILPTLYEDRTLHEREVLANLRQRFPRVFAPIPRSVKFRDSALAGVPLLTFDSAHPGAMAYRALAQEIV